MGTRELDTIEKFVTSDPERWNVGLEICRALPQVMQRTFSNFMEQIVDTSFERYTVSFYCRWDYYSVKKKACLGMYKESWRSASDGRSAAYSKWSRYTQIRLEAWSWINQWSIGVKSDTEELAGDLKAKLEEGVVKAKVIIQDGCGGGGLMATIEIGSRIFQSWFESAMGRAESLRNTSLSNLSA